MHVSSMLRDLAWQQIRRGRAWRLLGCRTEAHTCAQRARYWHHAWFEQLIAEKGWPMTPANRRWRGVA